MMMTITTELFKYSLTPHTPLCGIITYTYKTID